MLPCRLCKLLSRRLCGSFAVKLFVVHFVLQFVLHSLANLNNVPRINMSCVRSYSDATSAIRTSIAASPAGSVTASCLEAGMDWVIGIPRPVIARTRTPDCLWSCYYCSWCRLSTSRLLHQPSLCQILDD